MHWDALASVSECGNLTDAVGIRWLHSLTWLVALVSPQWSWLRCSNQLTRGWKAFYHCRYRTGAGYWTRAIFGLVSLLGRYLQSYLYESFSCAVLILSDLWWGQFGVAFTLLSTKDVQRKESLAATNVCGLIIISLKSFVNVTKNDPLSVLAFQALSPFIRITPQKNCLHSLDFKLVPVY